MPNLGQFKVAITMKIHKYYAIFKNTAKSALAISFLRTLPQTNLGATPLFPKGRDTLSHH